MSSVQDGSSTEALPLSWQMRVSLGSRWGRGGMSGIHPDEPWRWAMTIYRVGHEGADSSADDAAYTRTDLRSCRTPPMRRAQDPQHGGVASAAVFGQKQPIRLFGGLISRLERKAAFA